MKMKSSLGIRTQLIAAVVILTFSAIGFIGVLSVSIVQNNAITGRVQEASRVASLIRVSLEELFLQSSTGQARFSGLDIKERSMRLVRIVSVGALRVNDAKGEELFTYGLLPDRGERAVSSEPSTLIFFNDGIKISSIGETGWFKGPGRLLYVEIGPKPGMKKQFSAAFTLSLRDISSDLASMRSFIIIFGIADSIIIIALGLYFLSAIVMGPIRRLEGTAAKIARGDLGVRAEVENDDEIGSLARRFNTMADRLGAEINRLERLNVELHDTQAELLRAGALAAVGSLAAGLAHEIGNPLGAVSGYVDILGKGAANKEEEAEILMRAGKELGRMDRILREFLDIARPTKDEPEELDINALVEETAVMFGHHSRGHDVTINLDLNKDLPPVIIDEGRLRQIFTNLLLNAADAMDGSGVITVESRFVTISGGSRLGVASAASSKVEQRVRRDDPDAHLAAGRRTTGAVEVSFTDSGSGIKAEDVSRIFDPFFTTKEPGSGTGLGLFVSASMIKACGGTIEVKSEQGVGSTFTVIIPSVAGGSPSGAGSSLQQSSNSERRER
ncbi:hypothetical protein MNBD_DELTA01-1578 [hydrothermal vent metagenome]|uniref:histidine kinase n=1 Tax=hydrothermal vent metagenome TaxID=652676 RepID=A0A3B0QWG7_9ZZZZ